METINARVMNRYGTESEWLLSDPVLLKGEIALVTFGEIVRFKIGDGIKKFSQIIYNENPTNLKGLALAATNPGTPTDPEVYFATPGVTYTNFKDQSNASITIPTEVAGKPVLTAYLIFNGTYWSADYTGVDIEFEIGPRFIAQSDVKGVGYINLFDESSLTNGFVSGDGGLYPSSDWRRMRTKPLAGISKITLSAQSGSYNPSNNKNVVFYDSNDAFISRLYFNSNPKTFDLPVNAAYAWVNVGVLDDGDNLASILSYHIMMNKGDMQQPYVSSTVAQGYIKGVLGYNISTIGSEMTYSQLKAYINASLLVTGERYFINNAPGGIKAIVTAASPNSIHENIIVLNQNYDFFKIDLVNNRVYAFDNISGIARNSGGWYFINDGDHKPKGMASISALTDTIMQIVYSKTYSKILSLTYSPDETYALNGIMMGASVGNNVSNFNFSQSGMTGAISNNGSALTIDNTKSFQSAIKTVAFNSTTGEVIVTHSKMKNSGVSILSLNPLHRPILVSSTETQIVFKNFDITNTLVTNIAGMGFEISRTGTRELTNAEVEVAGSNIWIYGLMMNEFV